MSLHALAGHMAAKGRGSDSMLVHMTPEEVQSLQVLALRAGGTLTINPETGLPEANFLKKLLPTIAGFALNYFAPGFGSAIGSALGTSAAVGTGIGVGGLSALATGSLSRGLMAGLGAYGGASLASGLSGAGAAQLGQEAVTSAATELGAGATDAALQEAVAAKLGPEGAMGAFKKLPVSEQFSAGLKAAANTPGQFVRNNLGAAYAAATPILADQMVPTTTKLSDSAQTPSYIRPFLVDQYSQQMQALTPIDASKVRMRGERDFAGGGIVALADGGISTADIQGYLAARPGLSDTQIAAAMDQFKVTPEQMAAATGLSLGDVQGRYNAAQQNISGIQNAFTQNYATAAADDISDYIRGVGGIANVQAALGAENMQKLYGTSEGGTPFTNLAGLYQLQTGGSFAPISSAINQWIGENVGTYKTAEEAAAARAKGENAMLKAGMNEFDVLKATGKTLDQIFGFTPDKIVKTVTDLPGGGTGTTDTYTGGVSTTPATYAPPGTTNPYGNYMNPGDITRNADGTITVQPNIPGRPFGGFTGMGQVRDAYTAGGGSLGYTPYAPKTIQEFENRFTTSGGSKQAYDFLMNKGAADIRRPVTRTGELMLPYAEAMGLRRPGRAIMPRKPVVKKDEAVTSDTSNAQVDVAANGGVMRMALGGLGALAAGGSTSQYNLGSYSDGGRLLRGPGDGVSDSIPATIGDKQPARLADGEFVVPARIVSELGNGSTEAGARKLYAMMDRVQKARGKTTGKNRVAANTRADKYLPA